MSRDRTCGRLVDRTYDFIDRRLNSGPTLIEKHPHLGRYLSAPRRVVKNGASLITGNARKLIQELRDFGSVFEILKQGRDRYAGTLENPRPAYPIGVTFYSRAGGPIDHVYIPPLAWAGGPICRLNSQGRFRPIAIHQS